MSAPKPAHWQSSRRLLNLDRDEEKSALQCAEAAKQLSEKLRLGLVPLIGAKGFDALFARSVNLAASSLAAGATPGFKMEPTAKGPEVLGELLALQRPSVAATTAATVFATLFALMATFIGESLTEKILLKIGLPIAAAGEGEQS